MSSAKLVGYRLTPKAVDDLEEVWRYSAENWGVDKADLYADGLAHLFDTLVENPVLAPERTEFTPPVHIHTHQSHLVIYIIEDDQILIVRILGGQQDWRDILRKTEL